MSKTHKQDGWRITPAAGLTALRTHREGSTERGTIAALKYDAESYDRLILDLGADVSKTFRSNGTSITPHASFSIAHDFISDTFSYDAQFAAGGPSFETIGRSTGRTTGRLGLGLTVTAANGLSLSGGVQIEQGADVATATAGVEIGMSF